MSDISWSNQKRKLGELKPWVRNPRQINKDQAKRLSESFDEFGQVETIAVGPDNEVYNGHQRLSVLLDKHGKDYEVEVRVSSRALTEKEREKLTVFLHKGAAGEWNFDMLANEFEVDELVDLGFAPEELGIEIDKPVADAEPQIDRAAELNEKWQVKTGDLWQIGEHRLLCGDSTKREDVERVMDGEKARLVWTDPPYGVDYGAKLDAANPMGYRVRTIENDDLPPDKLEEFVRAVLTNVSDVCIDGAAIYVACPAGTLLPTLISAFAGSGFDFHWGLIWLKDQIVLSRADYHFKHENILYGWKPGAAHYFIDNRKQSSVFEYPRPKKSEEHPTMKPIELIQHMVRNSSEIGNIVIDAFGGSGSTMLACQNEGRACRLVELSPNYCAVILERMATAFPELAIERIIQNENRTS